MNLSYAATRVDITQLLSGDTVSREAASHPTDETGMSKHSQSGEWHSMATPSPPKAGGRWRAKETEVEPSRKQKRKARADIIRPRRPTPTRTRTHAHALTHTQSHDPSNVFLEDLHEADVFGKFGIEKHENILCDLVQSESEVRLFGEEVSLGAGKGRGSGTAVVKSEE